MVKLLAESDKPSDRTDLGISIYVYLDASEVKGVWGDSFVGLGEYGTDGEWRTVAPRDPRILELQEYSLYKVDWGNDSDFDQDGESKTLDMYSKGELTEDYVKENLVFVRGPVTDEE